MIKDYKNIPKYKTIGQVAKELDLIDKKTNCLQTHTLRYWETQFKQIKPAIRAGKRRYYSQEDFKILKFVKYLLKDKGLTINGVKKILNNTNKQSIDPGDTLGIYKPTFDNAVVIKEKIKNISKIIKDLKKFK